jgi:hypothetical protein
MFISVDIRSIPQIGFEVRAIFEAFTGRGSLAEKAWLPQTNLYDRWGSVDGE